MPGISPHTSTSTCLLHDHLTRKNIKAEKDQCVVYSKSHIKYFAGQNLNLELRMPKSAFFHSTTTISLPSDFPIDLLQQSACYFTTLSKISRTLAIAKLLSAIGITWRQSIPGILYSFPLLITFSSEKLVYKSPHWTVHIFYHFCIIVLIISPSFEMFFILSDF